MSHLQASVQLKYARWIQFASITDTSLKRIPLSGADEDGWQQRNLPLHPPHGVLHLEQTHSCWSWHTLQGIKAPRSTATRWAKPSSAKIPVKKPRTCTGNPTNAKEHAVHFSLLFFTRHNPTCFGQCFWDRHPLDTSAHALPKGQCLTPPSLAVTPEGHKAQFSPLWGCPTSLQAWQNQLRLNTSSH